MDWSLRIRIFCAGVFGLLLGWYGSAALAGPVMRVHVVFPRTLAALLGAGMAGLVVYLWRFRKKRLLPLMVVGLGLLAIVGLGLCMLLLR